MFHANTCLFITYHQNRFALSCTVPNKSSETVPRFLIERVTGVFKHQKRYIRTKGSSWRTESSTSCSSCWGNTRRTPRHTDLKSIRSCRIFTSHYKHLLRIQVDSMSLVVGRQDYSTTMLLLLILWYVPYMGNNRIRFRQLLLWRTTVQRIR